MPMQNHTSDAVVLLIRYDEGGQPLPMVDVFITTADAQKEPPLATANTILSVLAADYPPEKYVTVL